MDAKRTRYWIFVLLVVVAGSAVLILTMGGGEAQDAITVSFSEKLMMPPVQQVAGIDSEQPGDGPLRVAFTGVLSPTKTLEYYQELLTHMEQKMRRRVMLILKPTYAEINDLLRSQRADVAFVCGRPYVDGNRDFGMELLVAPQMYGDTVYYSYLIVPRSSKATKLEDLRGASFAFSDPMSNSGHLAPTYQLSSRGESAASFFSRYVFTYSHDNSVVAVADKLVEGGAVDSLVYDQLIAGDAELANKTKVIARWGPYGIPPVVVNPSLDPPLKQQLRDFFLDLDKSSEGRGILRSLAIDKFVVVPDSNYDSIREMIARIRR